MTRTEIRQLGPMMGPSFRVASVVASGRLTEGPYLHALEDRLSEMSGAQVRAVSSGAAALDIAMEVLRIARFTEDFVSVPVVGHWTDLASVVRSGYHARWTSVDEEGQAVSSTSDLSLWINIGGNRKRNPPTEAGGFVVCDVSHTTGDPSSLGWGDIAVASLYATKVLTAGEGGLVATRHEALVPIIESLRDGGRDTAAARTGKESWLAFGSDRRMPELSAALCLDSLDTLDVRVSRRREILARYAAALVSDGTYPYMVDTSRGAYKALIACGSSVEADRIRRHLEHERIVPASGVFDVALPDQGPRAPGCDSRIAESGRRWAARHVALPFHEYMHEDQVAAVCAALTVAPH